MPKGKYKRSPEHNLKILASRKAHKEQFGGTSKIRPEEIELPPADPDYPPSCGRQVLKKRPAL